MNQSESSLKLAICEIHACVFNEQACEPKQWPGNWFASFLEHKICIYYPPFSTIIDTDLYIDSFLSHKFAYKELFITAIRSFNFAMVNSLIAFSRTQHTPQLFPLTVLLFLSDLLNGEVSHSHDTLNDPRKPIIAKSHRTIISQGRTGKLLPEFLLA